MYRGYRSWVSHLSYEHGSRGVDIEDFREGGVQDQGNALRQGSGKFHFQSAVSISLGIEGIVRIHLQDVQTITYGGYSLLFSSDLRVTVTLFISVVFVAYTQDMHIVTSLLSHCKT